MLGKAQTRFLIGFICGFLYATTNISHYIAPNNKMSETKDGTIWKEAKRPNLKRCSGIYLQQARRTNHITQSV